MANKYTSELNERIELFKKSFISNDGTCTINEQTSVSMVVYYNLFDNIEPLKLQLKHLVEEKNFHHNCGMVGLRRLFIALNKCGLEEYAYKIITAKGFPSFLAWKEAGATTLLEKWQMDESQNHQMYSDFMSWIIKTLVGINLSANSLAYQKVDIKPIFIDELKYCHGYTETPYGKITVSWKRHDNKISLKVTIPEGVVACCKYVDGGVLKTGENNIEVLL